MIQVCSQCGTRWNVRDKQRSWCPRCNGTLLAPTATEPSPPPSPNAGWSAGPRNAPRLPPGYRWIAVRPGPPPPPRRRRRPLGPTPRYPAIPRWGLQDRVDRDSGSGRDPRQAPPADRVRTSFFVSAVALGAAALVHLLRYLLLVINRNTLLNWLVADAAALLSVLASLAAIAAVMTTALPVDPLVDRPSRRGIRTCRAVGFPIAAGVVDRHAAAAVGRAGAGHRLCRGRGDDRALGQLGLDGGVRDVQLSAAAGVRLGAGLRDRAGQDRRPLRPDAAGHLGLVADVADQQRDLGVRVDHQRGAGRPRASPTTPWR